jgi:ArsR family transcriptional regulator, arsenate/arsenite/antimonite-responsive transcriptional repressor
MKDEHAIDALSALAHPTRLKVFRFLVKAGEEGVPAGEIARQIGVPVTTMSTHLGILSRAGLIDPRRESRAIYYALNVIGTRELLSYLLADCCGGRPDLCGPVGATPMVGCLPFMQVSKADHELI